MKLKVHLLSFLCASFHLLGAAGQPENVKRKHETPENMRFVDDFSQMLLNRVSKTGISSEIQTQSSTICSSQPTDSSVLTESNVISGSGSSSTVPVLCKETSHFPLNSNESSDLQNDTTKAFISFDEWRVAKLNEAPAIVERRVRSQKRIETMEGDSLGDDMEIELGFFSNVDDNTGEEENEPEGKIYSHKFNFASIDCAATVVMTNSEASGAASILIENKDKYLLNPCSAPNQFIIIELCQDILVEELGIANFEFFSSTFSQLRFSVSDRYPVSKNGWRILGEFEAENTRNLQMFSIANPQIWARYLRIEILSHHGDEYYCPISLIKVHGKTMMDEFKMENSQPAAMEEAINVELSNQETDENYVEKIAEECDLWPSINPDNITSLPQFPDYFKSCRSKLEPLKFEEFLRELNGTYCLPKYSKDMSHNLVSSSTSSFSSPSSSTEESIFKNIIKRLTSLESNTTLTVLYIEEQGRLLSKSFEQLERTQTLKFDNLVTMFNETIMDNLEVLRIFANQLRDQSIRILEEQKLNNDQFTTQNILRLENLEKEVRMQRNFVYIITCALLLALVYMLLSREPYFDEFLKKDGIFNPGVLTSKGETLHRSFVPIHASPSSLSESSTASD